MKKRQIWHIYYINVMVIWHISNCCVLRGCYYVTIFMSRRYLPMLLPRIVPQFRATGNPIMCTITVILQRALRPTKLYAKEDIHSCYLQVAIDLHMNISEHHWAITWEQFHMALFFGQGLQAMWDNITSANEPCVLYMAIYNHGSL